MPAAKRRKTAAKPRARAVRSSPRARWRPRAPQLSDHQLDLLGLGLVAVGIFLAFVVYLGWSGGEVGHAAERALRLAVGLIAYLVPVALVVAGALVVFRAWLPPARPLRAGAVCLFCALALGFTAGTFAIGPGAPHASEIWHPDAFDDRGGVAGAALYWVSSELFSTVGAHIIAVFSLLAAILLLSGATIAGLARGAGSGALNAGRALRDGTVTMTAPLGLRDRGGRAPDDDEAAGEDDVVEDAGPQPEPPPRVLPPEPQTEELVVRATHVEAPALDGARRYPDIYGDEPAPAPADDELDPDAADEPAGDSYDDEQDTGSGAAAFAPGGAAPSSGGDEPAVPDPSDLTPAGRYRDSVTDSPDFEWRLPSPGLLTRSTGEQARPDTAGQEQIAGQLVEALGHFGVKAKVVGTVAGPHITRYELRLAPGTKVAKVSQLKDDLAYALAATDIRILAPIPGKQAVGVEVPNSRRRIVHLGDVYQDPPEDWSPLTVWLGKDVSGRAIGADLAKMPHLLVAGTTGAGKSGSVNAMLSSILLRASPHDVRLVLVDPKQVELNHYDSIPHLLTPVITSPRMAANALQNLVREMEERYGLMSLARTRSLPELNRARETRGEPPLPYVLCVIDELADLMMVAPADVEDSVIRLAQKARAVGIHLVLATQSPRVDVITGMIKANVPSRIAFAVSSQTDSRVILDQNGAEALLGQGDMLFSPVGSSRLQRIQGAYIDEPQIAQITDWWRRQGEPELREELLEEVEGSGDDAEQEGDSLPADEDPLLEQAISLVAQMGTASTSMLQRRLRLGYTRAGRLIDMLERRGVISGYEGSKPRQVLITEADLPRVLAALGEGAGGGRAGGVQGAAEDESPAQVGS